MLSRLGNLYLRENKVDTALYYVNKVIKLNKNFPAMLLLMGDINQRKGNNQKALENYKAAAIAGSRVSPGSPIYTNPAIFYKKIAEVFNKQNQNDSAFFYARKAFNIALVIKNPAVIISTCDVLINLFAKENKYDSAFTYQQLLIQKKDSLFTEEKDRQIHNIYFNEKLKQQDLAIQEDKQRSLIKIYFLVALSLVLILTGIGYRARMKSRFLKQLADTEMRALRAQMNPHFIFNCLASINRYIVKSDSKSASTYLTKFSKLIRLILDNSANEFISIYAEIQTLRLYLEMEALRFDGSFEYEIQADTILRADNTAIPAMIIQPYVENAIWHGLLHLPETAKGQVKQGKIWLRFLQQGEDKLIVEIEDNGIGRRQAAELKSKDILKTKSYGMQISKDRISIINRQQDILSSINVEDKFDEVGNPTGTKVTLHLPLIEMYDKNYYTKTTQ
jgi:tetratricopeptide (TPR) repeat protein